MIPSLLLFLLLLLLLLCPPTTAQNTTAQNTTAQSTTDACCSLTQSALEALSATGPPCTAFTRDRLPKKCQTCPAGLCRLDNFCICPRTFLESSSHRSRCEYSFAAIWPDSIPKEDRDNRSCQPNVTLPVSLNASCCAMPEQQLQNLRGFNENCPSTSYSFKLAKKCKLCPLGLCRIGNECICPDRFLDRSMLHEDCAPSFTETWPRSIPREDRASRSCLGVPAPNSTRTSCCSMTEEVLSEMIGTSDRCPDTSHVSLSDECGMCPSGMCRFGSRCYCPTYFMESIVKDRCEFTFGVAWPESIGKIDPDITDCSGEPDPAPSSTEQPSADVRDPPESQSDDPLPNSKPHDPSNDTSSSSNGNENAGTASESPLNTLEIIGVIAGVISAVVALVGLAIGLKRRRKHQGHEEQPSFDELFG